MPAFQKIKKFAPIESDFSKWKKLAQEKSKNPAFSESGNVTEDGIKIKPLYTQNDVAGLPHQNSMPGLAPYIRGPYPTMYCNRPWTIRQYAGFSTAEKSNQFYKTLLKEGAQGISVAFDLATHRGYDSDHERVIGDVGKAGVAIDSVEDMKVLFSGIPLNEVSVSMTMNGAVLPILAAYIVAAIEQGADLQELRGTIQNDILKEFMVRNTFIYPPKESMKIIGDVIVFLSQNMPKFNSISISGYHMQEAGASPAMELAYTLADGKEYIETALESGLTIDEFAPRLSFFFGVGMDFYSEIAKLRAARLLWSEIIRGFGAKDEKSYLLRMHCQTSGWTLTEKEPLNNIVRTTIESIAAVFGGTQSLHTNSYDEAVSLPTIDAAKIAKNTQLILQEETGICSTIDPWGGSYFMESLTNDIANKARELIREVEVSGGMTEAVEKGITKKQIEQRAAITQAKIDSGEKVIIGVNKYRTDKETPLETLNINTDQVRSNQIDRLTYIKRNRDKNKLKCALQKLKHCAKTGHGNLLAISIEAMRCRATVGEVSETLAKVWGRYSPNYNETANTYQNVYQKNDDLQEVLLCVKKFTERKSKKPTILVSKLGQDGHDRGAKVVASAFSDFGFVVTLSPLFSTPKEVVDQAIAENVDIIGISSLAGSHLKLVSLLLEEINKHENLNITICLGGVIPSQDYKKLASLGVNHIFGPNTHLPTAAIKLIQSLNKPK
ncbi:methylmalonyl-CoA mutase [Endozoicomonas sp. G2_1]|uniref:methylmalonyl-CoA mutase n=1 Tax=Endozoicomonas sp. G2_1 TaxID=2821091 RepID=UPI001ADB50EB|nr:methylmalonyl-CoA mutase [Endozoicomonas sp. G2_1]MBO9489807.1 methylmalonyl-CoA mutase [Endozoicomonas sp. G2_1]